jgi:integrase
MPISFGAVTDQLIRNQQVAGSSPANGSKHTAPAKPPKGGRWPQQQTSSVRLPEMESNTVRALVERYIAEETPRKAATTQRADHAHARDVVAAWGEIPVEAITPRLVAALHRELSARGPVLANRVLCFVSQLCALAERDDLRPAASNPTRAIRRNSEPRRTNYLRPAMRLRFIDAAHDALAAGEICRSAWTLILMMLMAGLRWSDVRWLRWEEVDLTAGCLRLLPRGEIRRENKSRDQRTIPLSDAAVELLRAAPRCGPWVAPNRRTRQPYVDIRASLRIVGERAGVRVTPHWLRHTWGTAAAEAGCTVPEIGAVLGHGSSASAERYIHLAGTEARGAAQRAGTRMLRQVGGAP